jgi:hypothetical protein
MSQPNSHLSSYRGSQKHKNRPTSERKGTLCPEWTHTTPSGGYGTDPFDHSWAHTEAHTLFESATVLPNVDRRYATKFGIAFEAKRTNDGTWHGYPIPWESVPPEIVDKWVASKEINRRQMKKHLRKDDGDLKWALSEHME